MVRALVTDDELRTLCTKGFGAGRAWALREATSRGLFKDFSAGSPLASGFAPFDLEPGVQAVAPGFARAGRKKPKKPRKKKTKANQSAPEAAAPGAPVAAGLAVRAEDTGRVLMLQRTNDPDDPAAGAFEFGGGHIEAGETPFAAACREWTEEVGCPLPAGHVVGMWESPNGVYQGFVYSVPHEADVSINLDHPRTENPDAELHAKPETSVWMSIDDLPGMPALRTELIADLPRVLPALRAPARSSKAKAPDMPRLQGSSIDESDVMDYLQEHYPDSDLGWVARCLWTKDNVLLADVDYEDRPGGIDEDKVDEMVEKLKDGWQPHAVVLVAPSADSQMFVADGYHRCAGLDKSGQDSAAAWVGVPKPGNTGWRADIEQMQFTATNHGPGQ